MPEPTYPPEPWYLGGSLLVSVFLVPASALPVGFDLPDGRRPLRIAGRVVVGVAAVEYVPGGALEYDELLVALPSFGRGGLRVMIPQIWVDSEASKRGGRELWGIPKHLARFERTTAGRRTQVRMLVDGRTVAGLAARRGRALLPGLHQIALPILQRLEGRTTLSRNLVIGRVSGLRTAWRFADDGPLAWLRGVRPALSVELHDAAIVFGMRVQRDPAASVPVSVPESVPASSTPGSPLPRSAPLPEKSS
ncbi:acetoacetate decarboxylase family protein [Herbiconiux sp. P15]|uniref:acetoacetate decarboxylase family protein n=1 Tax=Herbiconiux liukaitaii TaxID=3342799 RepID=UPI0035B768D2